METVPASMTGGRESTIAEVRPHPPHPDIDRSYQVIVDVHLRRPISVSLKFCLKISLQRKCFLQLTNNYQKYEKVRLLNFMGSVYLLNWNYCLRLYSIRTSIRPNSELTICPIQLGLSLERGLP